MAIDWRSVLLAFGGQVTLLIALGFLLKAFISYQLSKEAEVFRITLRAQADVEIERLRSSLQITATEHQVRFSSLHEKRASVIAELYGLLFEAADAAIMIAAHPNDETFRAAGFEIHRKLFLFFRINQIYLPSTVCRLLEKYVEKISHSVVFVSFFMRVENPNQQMRDDQNRVLKEAWHALETEIPAMRSELEKEFRSLLGVENPVMAKQR